MIKTPKELEFMIPGEWEHHQAVWLAWPYDETTFPDRLENAELVFCQIIKVLQTSETVELLVLDERMKERVTAKLGDISNINFHTVDYGDVWIRDYGPMFLVNKKEKALGFVKAEYNAYGKGSDPYYAPLLKDNEIFDKLSIPGKKFKLGIVLEGGAIDPNGEGVLLTTEQCLLNPNRNPHLNKAQTEEYLQNYLGIEKIIWLKQGLFNDHTDGHIDEIARFVTPNKIVVAYEEDPKDENYETLKENFEILSKEPFEIIKLPMPHMNYDDGSKAPVSYCNFYIGNKVVLAPIFNDPNDAKALEILQSVFHGRKVVGIDCRDLIYGGGAIHCMTQQQPAV